MKKKGFTLIELLAVIVILAIIALIATPAVLNVIEDSRKSAAEASTRNIVSAAKTYYMSEIMSGRTIGSIDLSTDILKYDGEQAEKGNIIFTDGKVNGKLYINGYCVEVALDGKVTSEKKDIDDCTIEVTPLEPVVYIKYENGQPIYYDPVNNIKCTENQVLENYNNYKTQNSVNINAGLKTGCMKFYAFLDSEESSTVKLLLDHNTTAGNVVWSNNGDISHTIPDVAIAQVATDTDGWHASIKDTARLLKGAEIVTMVSPKTTWNLSDTNTSFYFHDGSNIEYKGAAGTNSFAWLFDNTKGCTVWGCNSSYQGDDPYGYWVEEPCNTAAWWVSDYGNLITQSRSSTMPGIRPVIEVSKSIFE